VSTSWRGQRLRLVFDTNIVVSALLWQGAPMRLLQLAIEQDPVKLFTSEQMLDELHNTLSYSKFATRIASRGSSVEELVGFYKVLAETIVPAPIQALVPRDKDDDMVVATAIGAFAHAIVSGDRDLTELEHVADIAVLQVWEATELIEDNIWSP
jgi:uncharacterized protein